MHTHNLRRILWAFFASLLFGGMHSAHAGLFRTYLSVNGNDANPCTVSSPCRLLPAALAAVNDGGEVWMLDSGNFNTSTVFISGSVTILAIPGALGSLVGNGSHVIFIASPGVKVALRNLNLLNLSGTGNYGVSMLAGAELTLENCEIYGLSIGINVAAANSVLAIKDTVIRDNVFSGVDILGTVKATLDRVHLLNGSTGLRVWSGASAAVSNSVVANNASAGIYIYSQGGTASRLLVANSLINANSSGIYGGTLSTPDAVSITLRRNVINGNFAGVSATALAAGSTATVVLDNNALIANTTAISYASPAVVFSRGNNTAKLNGTDVNGPAVTSLPGL